MKKNRVLFVIFAIAAMFLTVNVNARTAYQNGVYVGGGTTYGCNVDLKNLGPDAYDLAAVLKGQCHTSNHYDGYHSGDKVGWFSSFTETYNSATDTTTLHWQVFSDGNDDMINNQQIIHVGWTTNCSNDVKEMYWTDKAGNRIPGSVVYNLNTNWTYRSNNHIAVSWANELNVAADITIRDVEFAVLATAVPLEDLNTENNGLNSSMNPLPGGQTLTIPKGKTAAIELPAPILPGAIIVLKYKVEGAGSDAVALNYAQMIVE